MDLMHGLWMVTVLISASILATGIAQREGRFMDLMHGLWMVTVLISASILATGIAQRGCCAARGAPQAPWVGRGRRRGG